MGLSVRGSVLLLLPLNLLLFAPPVIYADHERWVVGEMRDVDPAATTISATSGSCVPSHDRERLSCYFTAFSLSRAMTDENLKKDEDEVQQTLKADPGKLLQSTKTALCTKDILHMQPGARKDLSPRAVAAFNDIKTFCDRPTTDGAAAALRALTTIDGKKCRCLVSDWRSTLVRQRDRWVENRGPSGRCGVITVFTLIPADPKKLSDPIGPILWTLTEKTITTHKSDDRVCANPTKNPFLPNLTDGAMTLAWNAPPKTIECDTFVFTSGLEGMAEPRGQRRQ